MMSLPHGGRLPFLATALALVAFDLACSGGGNGDPARDGASLDAADAIADVAADADVRDGGADAGGMALAGSWYHRLPDTIEETGAAHRLRFLGEVYYLVREEPDAYCAETGRFSASGSTVRFQPDHIEGFGRCQQPRDRVEQITWEATGFSLALDGVTIPYRRIRALPKLFVTVETHDGNLAGDTSLPGANAIAKADAFCNASLAKPDGEVYRALLVDGLHRTALPAKDWPLQPLTTYFAPDGASNALTTDATAADSTIQGRFAVGADTIDFYWSGSGPSNCNGWTTGDGQTTANVNPLGHVQWVIPGQPVACNLLDLPLLCVGEGRTLGELAPPPAPGTTAGVPADAEGSWQSADPPPNAQMPYGAFRILRFEGSDYRLIADAQFSYCGEMGRVESFPGGLRLIPERIIGVGLCQIGEVRTAELRRTGTELGIVFAGETTSYRRPPDVPKLFLTIERHTGDFASDAALPGSGAFQKADAFCNRLTARPDDGLYKAVLADGVGRGALPAIDWVLKPTTTYFYGDGLSPALETDAMGRQPLATARRILRGGAQSSYLWSGLTRVDFSASPDNCAGWTSASPDLWGGAADVTGSLGAAFKGICNVPHHLVCARQ